jgi:hypothetical protein
MDPSEKLFTNQFISTNVVTDRTNEEYDKYRRDFLDYWMEKNAIQELATIGENAIDPLLRVDDLLNTNKIDFEPTNGQENFLQQADESTEERSFKTRKTLVNIDSRDRDILLYPEENHYKIDLRRQFTNVKLVQLRSTEFPNSEQLIRATPPSRANNKIFWNNLNDSTVYVTSIDAGNYTPGTLQTEIQTKMNSVRKLDGNFHEFTVVVDSVTNVASFSSLTTKQLSDPFNVSAPSKTITVNMQNHGFSLNQLITISGASSFSGINVALLNGEHVITSVPNPNSFTIEFAEDIIESTPATGSGGSVVRIGSGQNFRLLWSQPGTVADILGFNPVDTDYSTLISNTKINSILNVEKVQDIPNDTLFAAVTFTQPHDLAAASKLYLIGVSGSTSDELVNSAGGYSLSLLTNNDINNLKITNDEVLRTVKIPIQIGISSFGTGGIGETRVLNKPVKLAGENYFLMTSPQLASMENTGLVRDVFAKISLSASPGNILFNTFMSNPLQALDTPIPTLHEIEVFFKTQDDNLFDFVGLEHSFTLEIVEYLDKASRELIGFSSQRGVVDNT